MKTETKNRLLNSVTLPNYAFKISAPVFQKNEEEFTIWFFESILEKYPDYIDCLIYLGNVYTLNGMYEKGLVVDKKLSHLKPDDAIVHYNLTCSYALVKDIDAAFNALEKAISLGYKDVYHLERDADLSSLREDARYKQLIEKIKKR